MKLSDQAINQAYAQLARKENSYSQLKSIIIDGMLPEDDLRQVVDESTFKLLVFMQNFRKKNSTDPSEPFVLELRELMPFEKGYMEFRRYLVLELYWGLNGN